MRFYTNALSSSVDIIPLNAYTKNHGVAKYGLVTLYYLPSNLTLRNTHTCAWYMSQTHTHKQHKQKSLGHTNRNVHYIYLI